jgi:type II secretory pathway pseudopilin PulG
MRQSIFTILIAVLMSIVSTNAAGKTKVIEAKLQVWQADGKVVTYALDEEPVTTYVDGNLVIKTSKTTITYPLEDVRKFTYFLPNNLLLGDADGNGTVNTDDIVEVSNKIMGKPSDNFVEGNADVNGDGVVNAVDIVLILSSLLTPQ